MGEFCLLVELHPEGLQSMGLPCLVPCNEASSVVYKTNTIWLTMTYVVYFIISGAVNRGRVCY